MPVRTTQQHRLIGRDGAQGLVDRKGAHRHCRLVSPFAFVPATADDPSARRLGLRGLLHFREHFVKIMCISKIQSQPQKPKAQKVRMAVFEAWIENNELQCVLLG